MNIKELIQNGKIKPGTQITMTKKGVTIDASIKGNGSIETSDGQIFKSPSGAAKAFNGGKPIDGWLAWRLKENHRITLDSFRKS